MTPFRRLSCHFTGFVLTLVMPLSLAAQPGAGSLEDYERWVEESFLPERLGIADGKEQEAKDLVEEAESGTQAKNLRGASEGTAQSAAEYDELTIKSEQFFQCNDYRMSIFGDPEARPPKPCQEEVGFFDRPNRIGFMCPFGIFENACGSDRVTGNEIQGLLCRSDPGACGVHIDNKHPGRGGGIGISIISKKKSKFPPCTYIYVTATYVEYYFPWNYLNTSRQMYQSSYLDPGVVDGLRSLGQRGLRATAVMETANTADMAARAANSTVIQMTGGRAEYVVPPANPQAAQIALDATGALEQIDNNIRDLSPHGERQYTRNFSSTLDIRFTQPLYYFVPHYPLDTHRYGSEFPDLASAINVPQPTGTYLPILPTILGQRGGILYSRFLSLSSRSASARLQTQIGRLTTAGGPLRCFKNNKATGKVPQDFLPQVAAGRDDGTMCIDNVGKRFPLTSVSFSGHNTDAYWRGLQSGGIDLFYALNWPAFYDGDASRKEALARLAPFTDPYHTYLESFDRMMLMPNAQSSDPNFMGEMTQCGRLQELADVNVNYRQANIHTPMWGAQNTTYVYGLVKGPWGFRGRVPLYSLEWGNSRYPQIKYRFR